MLGFRVSRIKEFRVYGRTQETEGTWGCYVGLYTRLCRAKRLGETIPSFRFLIFGPQQMDTQCIHSPRCLNDPIFTPPKNRTEPYHICRSEGVFAMHETLGVCLRPKP